MESAASANHEIGLKHRSDEVIAETNDHVAWQVTA